MQNQGFYSFSGGLVSDIMAGREDLGISTKAFGKMKNFHPLSSGPATLFPGTKMCGQAADDVHVRLIPFITAGLTYVIVLTPLSARLWKDGIAVGSAVTTPWPGAALRTLQVAQDGAELYFVHKSYAPRKISLTAADTITLTTPSFTDEDGAAVFATTDNYPGSVAIFLGRLWFGGTVLFPQKIWASKVFDFLDFGKTITITTTFETIKDPEYVEAAGNTVTETVTLELTGSYLGTIKSKENYPDEGDFHYVYGAGIQSGTWVASIADNIITLSKVATETLTGGAFTFSLWPTIFPVSAPETTTTEVVTDECSVELEIASEQNETIQWLATGSGNLVIGTTTGEWVIPNSFLATSPSIYLQGRKGSAGIQAKLTNDAILFIQTGGKTARNFYYDSNSGSNQSDDISVYVRDKFTSSVVEFDFSQTPEPVTYFLLSEGKVLAVLYNRATGNAGWFEIAFQDTVIQSLAVVSKDGNDEIYLAFSRYGVSYIEKVYALSSGVHVHGAYEVAKSGNSVSGLTRFATKTVTISTKAVSSQAVVSAEGVVAVPSSIPDGTTLYIGLPVIGELETLPITMRAQDGALIGKPRRVVAIGARVDQSYPFKVGSSSSLTDATAITGPYSGDLHVSIPGSWTMNPKVYITQDSGLALTLLALTLEVDGQ